MKIIQGLPKEHEQAAVEVLFEGFESKYEKLIGTGDKAKEALRRSLFAQNCFIAKEDDKLLGVLGFQIGKRALIEPKLKDFIDIYGFWEGISRTIKMIVMKHMTKEDELYVADISVAAAARGKGVGTKLLDAIEQHAIEKGLKYLTLIVIAPNVRAKALYEKVGFVVEKKQGIKPIKRFLDLDFDEIYYMRKTLA